MAVFFIMVTMSQKKFLHVYKLTVAYDGTDYKGWQWQPRGKTIESVLRSAFEYAFCQTRDDYFLVGASRTDAGVHAAGQVVRLCTSLDLESATLMRVLNSILSHDIMIMQVQRVEPLFHPQHAIISKKYVYTVYQKRPSPQNQRYGWYFYYPVQQDLLKKTMTLFVGTHDFHYFCKEDIQKDTVRTLQEAYCEYDVKNEIYTITCVGSSFLRYMVRRIVGVALYVAAEKKITYDAVREALLYTQPLVIMPTAPSKGLCLQEIVYNNEARKDVINE